MNKYGIRDTEAGNVIEKGLTREEAEAKIAEYERSDKEDGIFTEKFYEIFEEENNSYFEVKQNRDIAYYDTLKDVAYYYNIEESEDMDTIQDELNSLAQEIDAGEITIRRIFY